MTTTTIQKWGNSAAVRLPAQLLAQMHVGVGAKVSIQKKGDVFTITPSRDEVPTIAELTARITPSNRHGLFDWGVPVGKEVW